MVLLGDRRMVDRGGNQGRFEEDAERGRGGEKKGRRGNEKEKGRMMSVYCVVYEVTL